MISKFKIIDKKYLFCSEAVKAGEQGGQREDCMIYELYVADTFIKRLMGYMFRKIPHHEAIMIKPCSSIHTYFMRFDIDVYFINENFEVISKIEALKPWKVVLPVRGAVNVIEIPRLNFK